MGNAAPQPKLNYRTEFFMKSNMKQLKIGSAEMRLLRWKGFREQKATPNEGAITGCRLLIVLF
jgi:hypothetical protein